MAQKETLQKDNDSLFFGFISILLALLLTWLFVTQFFFLSAGQASPSFTFKGYGTLAIFFGMGLAIVLSIYFLSQKNWRGFFSGTAACCILFLFKDGEAYNPVYLYYLFDQYTYAAVTNEIYLWGLFYFFITAGALFGAIRPWNKEEKGTHGTAVIQDGGDYKEKNFEVGGNGEIIIGKHEKTGKILTSDIKRHLITVASTGSGKSVSTIIPNLLHYPFSAVVVDPKGELCNYTANHRATFYDQKIICLDPFRESIWGKENGTNHFNPLDAIPNTYQKAFRPCNALVDTIFADEIEGNPFWILRAKNLYRGFLMYICTAPEFNDPEHEDYSPGLRNLSTVNHLFSLPAEDLLAYIENISISDVSLNVKRFANEFLSAGDSVEMLAGLTETLKGEIQLFHSPEISNVMAQSDFSYSEALANGTTIYLIVPPEELRTYSKWTRIMITIFTQRAIYERKTNMQESVDKNIIFLLDEFTNLGKLDIVRNNFAIARGYGIKFWIIFQDLGQLKELYKKSWTSFFSNADIVQAFGVGEIDTAEYFSRSLGETTVVSMSKSENKNLGFRAGGGKGTSRAEQRRRLYTADEVSRLPEHQQFIFIQGEHAILSEKITYYTNKAFKDLVPRRSDVFAKLKSLPREFEITEDDGSLEYRIMKVIYGKNYGATTNGEAEKVDSGETSTVSDKVIKIKPPDIGDDINLSPFR